jgi:hypothetical protein
MEYNKSRGGKWTDIAQLKDGMRAKIIDECMRQDSQFKDEEGNAKVENVAKVRYEGMPEAMNTRINWASINALIDAYGKDSKMWIDKVLTVRLIRALVAGKMRSILYFVPEGFELAEDAEGKMEIRKVGGDVAPEPTSGGIDYPKDDINPDDIPF